MCELENTAKTPRLKRTEYLSALLCFFVPSVITLFLYLGMGHYPISDMSVLTLDLNAQYAYFLEGLRDIMQGDGSILYSFSRSLGGEFPGMFAYYLASPLNLLILLFKKEHFLYSLLLILVLKSGLCGLSFGAYLRFKRKTRKITAVTFATMYALSGYCVVMQHNLMWTDNVILLPLICWGIEELIEHRGHIRYTVFLSLAILTNFYIGYMTCIFAVIYYIFVYFTQTPDGRQGFVKTSLRFSFWSLISGMISAIIVIPAYYSLSFGKTSFSNPDFSFNSRFDFIDLIAKLFPGSYDTVRPDGLPFVYCGTAALILFSAFFFCSKIPSRQRIGIAAVTAVLVFSFAINTVDMVWHGFQAPNWLNYRYSYMLTFIMLVCAARVWDSVKTLPRNIIFALTSSVFLVLIILQALPNTNFDDRLAVWTSLLLLIVAAITLIATRNACDMVFARQIACVILSLEMIASAALNMYCLGNDVGYSTWSSYTDFMEKYRPAAEYANSLDSDFYRVEKTVHRRSNDNFSLGLHGLSNSTSTLNADTIKLLSRLGFTAQSHWTKYRGATPVTDSLFGVRYIIAETNESACAMYEQLEIFDDLKVLKNPYALSLAYGVDSSIKNFSPTKRDENSNTVEAYENPFELQNALMTVISGASDIFTPIKDTELFKINCTTNIAEDHSTYRPKNAGQSCIIGWTFTAEQNGHIYAYFPSRYLRDASISVNSSELGSTLGSETQRIVDLGYYREGDEVKVSLTLGDKSLYIQRDVYYFYQLNEDAFKNAFEELSKSCWQIDADWDDDSLSGNITLSEGKTTMLTSIPYDSGWHIKIDGIETEYYEVLDSLIAFDIPSGMHSLEMYYLPSCYITAALISACGTLIFITVCIIKKRKSNNGK